MELIHDEIYITHDSAEKSLPISELRQAYCAKKSL